MMARRPRLSQQISSNRSRRNGFTMVELLVVIAIIALLISILLPSLEKAIATAKLIRCMTNMSGIGRAAMLYARDYNGYIPRDSGWRTPPELPYPEWLFFGACFSPYVGGPKIPFEHNNDGPYLVKIFKHLKIYQCPNFPYKNYTLTYITNGFNFVEPTRWGVPLSESRLEQLTRPTSGIVFLGECNPRNPYIASGGLEDPCFGAYDFPGSYTSNSPDAHLRWYCCPFDENGDVNTTVDNRLILPDDMRHDGKTSLAFFDGHVEARKLTFDELPPEIFYPKPGEE